MVQLFLQPIVPEVRIQGRKIAGFFRKQKQPTFILLEWKLDGGGGYLLTGMGIVPAQAASGEEISGKIRYFTFTCKYNGANAFDIQHIPLVEQRGNLLHLLAFREARDLMRDKQQKDPYLFGYFPQDEGADYRRHLAEFGIIQDEWRNVITKINDSEGGIDEIFQRYKTSSQLLDEWIIKNIEKSMWKDQTELHRLEDMLEKLVQEVTENESYLLERELLSGFLKVYAEQSKGLSVLLEGLEQQREVAEHLVSLHRYLTHQSALLEQMREENEQEQNLTRREEQRIKLKERSQDYLLKRKAYEAAQEQLLDVRQRLTENEGFLVQAQVAEKIQQAAKLLGEIRHKEAKCSGIEESLAAHRTDFDQHLRVGELEYTLKTLLEKAQADLEENNRQLQTQKRQEEMAFQEAAGALKEADNRQSSLDQQKGQLSERKKQLENQTGAALEKLNLNLRRNILGELNPTETEQIRIQLDQDLAAQQQAEKHLTTEYVANGQAITKLETDSRSWQTLQTEENSSLQSLRRDIQEYEERETEVKNLLNRYDLDAELLFQGERLHQILGQRIQTLGDRVEQAGIAWHEAQENLLIDINPQNSRLKLWEDAAHQNSGGEKFVVFFSVLSALMSYARTRAIENLGGVGDKESSSVLIMDNPFGPISSEHLLNPLFEIARKHRTQLICLSDLKQNSIMNCFNLIYMLKIRTTAMGNKEYLKFEEIIRDAGDFQEDERLEKAVFRSEVRQISMFGDE